MHVEKQSGMNVMNLFMPAANENAGAAAQTAPGAASDPGNPEKGLFGNILGGMLENLAAADPGGVKPVDNESPKEAGPSRETAGDPGQDPTSLSIQNIISGGAVAIAATTAAVAARGGEGAPAIAAATENVTEPQDGETALSVEGTPAVISSGRHSAGDAAGPEQEAAGIIGAQDLGTAAAGLSGTTPGVQPVITAGDVPAALEDGLSDAVGGISMEQAESADPELKKVGGDNGAQVTSPDGGMKKDLTQLFAVSAEKETMAGTQIKKADTGKTEKGKGSSLNSVLKETLADSSAGTAEDLLAANAKESGKAPEIRTRGEGNAADNKYAGHEVKADTAAAEAQNPKDLTTERKQETMSVLTGPGKDAVPAPEARHSPKEPDKDLPRTEADVKTAANLTHSAKTTTPDSGKAQSLTAPRGVTPIPEHTFVITKKSERSIEVSIEPNGIGKLQIELNLDKGVINAKINATDAVGKEIIERNLTNIMDTLVKEGIAVGGLSVSLRDRGGNQKGAEGEEDIKVQDIGERIGYGNARASAVRGSDSGVSIFV